MPEISFTGRVVVVTGGAGGIGAACCRDLASRGASLVVNDVAVRDDGSSAAEVLAHELRAGGAEAVHSDVSVGTPEGGAAVVRAAVATFGTVSAVIHMAGAWRNECFEDLSPEDWRTVLDVHLDGAFNIVQPAWRLMKERGYGRVVLASSSAGLFGRLSGANYAAAKAGLYGLGRALALEGEPHAIRVNCVLPNAVTGAFARPMAPEVRARLDELGAPIRSRRQPERVAPLVTYLASSDCSVTGGAFSGGAAGRYASAFVGLVDGWWGGEAVASAEDVRERLEEIQSRDSYVVPSSVFDELGVMADGMRRGL